MSLSLAGGASAATAVPAADVLSWDTNPGREITLNEEEIADVSLGTFYVFDKENAGTPRNRREVCARLQRLRRLQRLQRLWQRLPLRRRLRRRLRGVRLRRLRLLFVVGSLPHLLNSSTYQLICKLTQVVTGRG